MPRGARLLVAAQLLLTLACAPPPQPDRGALIEKLEPWGAAAEAGLAPGDVLLGWKRAGGSAAHERISSPMDVSSLERRESPQGPISVRLRREARELEVTMRRGEWEMATGPVMSPADRDRHADATRLAAEGDMKRASEIWGALAAAMDGDRSPDALWFRLRIGKAYVESRELEAARKAFAAAREGAEGALARSLALELAGEAFFATGEYAAAEATLAEAVALQESIAPDSESLAWTLRELGRARFHLVDLDGAEKSLSHALALYRRADSATLECSDTLNLLAGIALRRGDLAQAQNLYLEAAALREPLASQSPRMGSVLANLGLVAWDRGDLGLAERFLRRALAIDDRVGRARDSGYTLNYLGLLSRDKGDFEAARAYYERAIQSFRVTSPEGPEVAGMLNNLGNLARLEGDLATAERHHREALALRERLPEENLDLAASLHNLASILRRRGRPAGARPLLGRALAIKERDAPESLIVASTLFELGEIHRLEGDTGEAARLHRRALAIRRSAAPEGDAVAESLAALGRVAIEAGRAEEAERSWREAIDLVESRRGRLGFTTAERSRFSARFHELYRELADLLAQKGTAGEAFDVVERARALSLRVMMAQRDFAASSGVPAELVLERRRLEQSMESAESRLARMSVAGRDRLSPLHESQRELRRQLDEVNARIRDVAPRLGLLEDPVPVPIEDVRRALPAGTLLLSYSVGREATLLFAAGADPGGPDLVVERLPWGEEELERRVDVFRALIERGGTEVEPALLAQGRRLFDLLLAPVEESVAASDRIVVIPDGPLLTLPFAALVRSVEPLQYLSQWKTLSHSASGGVLTELRRSRPAAMGRARTVVAFGDPDPPRDASLRTERVERLPFAREEAERIGALFGEGARVFVGPDASEERVRTLGPEARWIHFATHAFPDARFPLDSALALSPQEGEGTDRDGWLHAWEIAETMRLDADLVTLSGCETGLGRELRGEGILGLARAFQYAGARSVLVSLWAVPDRSTKELMVRFYENLNRGLAKDRALRAAREELLSPGPDSGGSLEERHPRHWAGFRLIGDAE
jgi:CHAT domain-containing protein/tetratricopeptide (TPR) repeat protein